MLAWTPSRPKCPACFGTRRLESFDKQHPHPCDYCDETGYDPYFTGSPEQLKELMNERDSRNTEEC